MSTVDNTNILQSLRDFTLVCRSDNRLTPHTQLVYRVLIDLANRAYWSYPFAASNDELMSITHISSINTLNACKQRLKSLGYINFHGKPSKYIVYRPVDNRQEYQQDNPPDPPGLLNTENTNTNTSKKEVNKKESEEPRHDATERNPIDSSTAQADITALLDRLGY